MSNSNFQFDNFYINSRLSSLFTPIKDINNKLIYQMNDGINSKMIMNGIQLNKIGIFDPSELGKSPLLPNAHVTESNFSNNPQSSSSNSKPYINNANYLVSPQMIFNSNEFYHSYMRNIPSYIGSTGPIINNSIIAQQNNINQIKPFNIALDESTKDIFGLSRVKRKRFITKEIEESSIFTIEANKMTKKLLNENIMFSTAINGNQVNENSNDNMNSNNSNDNNNSSIAKTPKAKKNIQLSFEDNNTSSIVYQCKC